MRWNSFSKSVFEHRTSSLGGLFISNTFEGGCLIVTGDLLERGGVPSIYRRWWYGFSIKTWNAKWKSSTTRSWRSCNWGSKTNLNFQHVNKPSRISANEVLQLFTQAIILFIRQWKIIRGRRGGLNFLFLKRGGGLTETGLKRGFTGNEIKWQKGNDSSACRTKALYSQV